MRRPGLRVKRSEILRLNGPELMMRWKNRPGSVGRWASSKQNQTAINKSNLKRIWCRVLWRQDPAQTSCVPVLTALELSSFHHYIQAAFFQSQPMAAAATQRTVTSLHRGGNSSPLKRIPRFVREWVVCVCLCVCESVYVCVG